MRRHSFATNLKLAGVEELYVSESMGHLQSNDVTSGYQDMYPLEIRFRNNSELLDIEENKLEEDVENMTLEQAQAFIKMMLKQ